MVQFQRAANDFGSYGSVQHKTLKIRCFNLSVCYIILKNRILEYLQENNTSKIFCGLWTDVHVKCFTHHPNLSAPNLEHFSTAQMYRSFPAKAFKVLELRPLRHSIARRLASRHPSMPLDHVPPEPSEDNQGAIAVSWVFFSPKALCFLSLSVLFQKDCSVSHPSPERKQGIYMYHLCILLSFTEKHLKVSSV